MITRGTTPTLTFTLQDNDGNNVDLSEYEVLYITIQDSKKNQFDIDKSRFVFKEDFSFETTLTQEETLRLVSGRIKVQLRAKVDENAIASCEQYCTLADIIKQGKIWFYIFKQKINLP